MMKSKSKTAENFKDRFLFLFGKGKRLAGEKVRLEAFLSAFPGEYCGWSTDGTVAYSQGFLDMLGLDKVRSLPDIQGRLSPGDAAALEGVYGRLRDDGLSFELFARSQSGDLIFKISGSRGSDPHGLDEFNILWIEDATESRTAYEKLEKKAEEKEVRSKMFECAFNSILSPRWLRDKDGNLVWVNKGYSDLLGFIPKDIINDQKELTGSISKPKSVKEKLVVGKEQALNAIKTGEPQFAQTHINANGQRYLMKITEVALPEYDMALGLAEDISSEEEAQTQLKRYLASNKDLLGQLRSAISIYGADERLEFYNSAFSQIWSLEDGWLNTKPTLGDVMEKLRETRRLPEQADFRSFKQSWLAMFTTLIDQYDEMLYLPDGSAVRMLVIPHSMGGLMMNFEDVTSRLELESSYNTLIAVQKETLDNLGEAVTVFGGDGRIKLWNPAYARLWKLNPEDLEGEPHITTVVDKVKSFFDPAEWMDRREKMISKALNREMNEGRLTRADNSHIEYSTVPLPDGGVLIAYIDVTDSVRVENALREKNAALEAAERLKLDFLANVSYQLRTPLNAIMGFNEILSQEFFGPLNERQKEYTHDMNAASEKLLGLINDILDLATLEAGYMDMSRADVSIYTLVTDVKELVSEWARKGSIEIHVSCAKNIGKINADEKRLKQALVNVIRNAINFTPEGGKIEIAAKKLKEGIEIAVIDNGVGVDKEDKMRIFEPFERAHGGVQDGRQTRSGAGLGLALVKNIISVHGGEVSLESEPGQGTTVTIFLPHTSIATPLKIMKTG
ncbi:MAG: PAS domain-containing sensor histidine kinase [Micavibrio sp.]|nr:PAS domain-containing sensor histidine kinase [Micavibrio sp.]